MVKVFYYERYSPESLYLERFRREEMLYVPDPQILICNPHWGTYEPMLVDKKMFMNEAAQIAKGRRRFPAKAGIDVGPVEIKNVVEFEYPLRELRMMVRQLKRRDAAENEISNSLEALLRVKNGKPL